MENFVVSARKYRPSTFDSVIGQEHITTTLKNAIRNKQLAHAFLFCGPRGVGKTTCARILAKTINCDHITTDCEACNECDSCKSFNANASFNIYELDAASNNSVDDIRGLVEQIRYPPQGARYKIYIIDEVHMLSAAAFNAFLKTLEEPPPYAKFILATTEKHKILPTILSRCQVFDFHRITIEHAVSQLRKITTNEGIDAEEEALHVIAQKADGAMRDALSIFDRIVSFSGKKITYQDVILNLNILDYDYYFRAVEMINNRDVPGIFMLFDQVLGNGFDAQHFLAGLNDHIRNLLVCKYPETLTLLEVAKSVAERFKQQSVQIPISVLMNAMNLLNKCELDYRMSKNQRLHVELTLLKCCHIQSVIQLQSATVEDKKKTPELTPPAATAVPPAPVEPDAPATPAAPVRQTASSTFRSNTNLQSTLERFRQKAPEPMSNPVELTRTETVIDLVAEPSVLTESRFRDAWDQYLKQLEQDGKKSLVVQYKHASWRVHDENTIQLILSNTLERDFFEEERIYIMPFLRGKLQHPALQIEVEIVTKPEEKTAYTAEDRFKAMAAVNPLLNDLRNALGLELEY